MAKISIEVDTAKKEIDVTVDGKKMEQVMNVYLSTLEAGYFSVEVSQAEDVDKSTRKVTRLMASKKDDKFVEQAEEVDRKALAECLLKREVN